MKKYFAALLISFSFFPTASASSVFDIPVYIKSAKGVSPFFSENKISEIEKKIVLETEGEKKTTKKTEERRENVSVEISSNPHAQIFALREDWKLTSSYCESLSKKHFEKCHQEYENQKYEMKERKAILNMRKDFSLTHEICSGVQYEKNHYYCLELFFEQEKECDALGEENRIIIDLKHQILYGVKDCQVLSYTSIITGKNKTPTPTGKYSIYIKRGPHWMQGQWYTTKAMYFRGGYAVHDAGWRNLWDPEHRVYYGSHGCVNVPMDEMKKLWNMFDTGDKVEIYYTVPNDLLEELNFRVRDQEPAKGGSGYNSPFERKI